MLAERAGFARTRLQELRVALADTMLTHATRQALQRERWMEERWLVAAEEEAKNVENAAGALKAQPNTSPQPQIATLSIALPNSETRKQANLAKFFARSPTLLASARGRRVVLLGDVRVMSATDAEFPRLRTWPIGAGLRNYTPGSRPRSLDSKGTSRSAASVLGHGSARRRRLAPALQISVKRPDGGVVADDEWVHSAPACTTHTSFPQIAIHAPDDSSPSALSFNLRHELDAFPLPTPKGVRAGSALIYRLADRAPRPTDEILAEKARELDVPMPAYVGTLLDAFDGGSSAPLLSPSSSIASALLPSMDAFTRQSIESGVLVARPSVDSYHYDTLPVPRARSGSRLTSSLRHSLRLSRSFDANDGPTDRLGKVEEGKAQDVVRVRRRSFLRPARRDLEGHSDAQHSLESREGIMSRVRRRVSTLGRR
jgi:hypothetical protein